MKTKVYFFRLLIAVSTFVLGLGSYLAINYFQTETIEDEPHCSAQNNQPVEPISQILVTKNEITENNKEIENEFIPDGDYYLIGELSKDFKDFDYLEITANEYESEKDGTSYWKPIPPKGFIFTKTKFNFSRIQINNRQISFETNRIKGVSYTFIGTYPKNVSLNDGEDFVAIQGRLTKYKDGKKITEIEVNFGEIDGC